MMLTPAMCMTVFDAVEPTILNLMEARVLKREHLAIEVMRCDGDSFHYVFGRIYGVLDEWQHPYDEIARGKTALSARTGLPTRVVQELHPELLLPGDVKFWGNAMQGDLIVSCSGVQPWYDEAIAKVILALLVAGIDELRRNMAQESVGVTYDSGAPRWKR